MKKLRIGMKMKVLRAGVDADLIGQILPIVGLYEYDNVATVYLQGAHASWDYFYYQDNNMIIPATEEDEDGI